jgi:hypothetical protein
MLSLQDSLASNAGAVEDTAPHFSAHSRSCCRLIPSSCTSSRSHRLTCSSLLSPNCTLSVLHGKTHQTFGRNSCSCRSPPASGAPCASGQPCSEGACSKCRWSYTLPCLSCPHHRFRSPGPSLFHTSALEIRTLGFEIHTTRHWRSRRSLSEAPSIFQMRRRFFRRPRSPPFTGTSDSRWGVSTLYTPHPTRYYAS